MSIRTISTEQLCRMGDQEGLIMMKRVILRNGKKQRIRKSLAVSCVGKIESGI